MSARARRRRRAEPPAHVGAHELDDLTDDGRCRRSAADLDPSNDRHVACLLAATGRYVLSPSSPTSAGGIGLSRLAVALLVHTLAPRPASACTGKFAALAAICSARRQRNSSRYRCGCEGRTRRGRGPRSVKCLA